MGSKKSDTTQQLNHNWAIKKTELSEMKITISKVKNMQMGITTDQTLQNKTSEMEDIAIETMGGKKVKIKSIIKLFELNENENKTYQNSGGY